jgi:glycerol-3-phosphate dehydrogenase
MPEDSRQALLREAGDPSVRWDVLVIGGGATGLATAWDAVSRGLRVALLEQSDFAKATSSRSTKLVHGGVRYLQKGEVDLVVEALRERRLLLHNAPEYTRPLRFVLPATRPFGRHYYRFGLCLYDFLAGKSGLEKASLLDKTETLECLPRLVLDGLKGGVAYTDGQFDDAALCIGMAQAIRASGGLVLNYAPVEKLLLENGKVSGLHVRDEETGAIWEMRGPIVINATGIFADALRQKNHIAPQWTVRASRGSHLVCRREILGGDHALIIPKTRDGRVLFAIPWKDRAVVGTTDVPAEHPCLEPEITPDERRFILVEAGRALGVTAADVTSQWAGLRPLVSRASVKKTASLSRKHVIEVSSEGLVTVLGGKWTTARHMGEDAIRSAFHAHDRPVPASTTADRPLSAHGARPRPNLLDEAADPGPSALRTATLEAVRHGFARNLDDVLSRRLRVLPLDAGIARELAPSVADIMAAELGWRPEETAHQLAAFLRLSQSFLPSKGD